MLRSTALLCTAAMVTLAACQPGNEYAYDKNPNTYKGAAAGAAVGGVAGALVDDDNRGDHAAIGAAIGALAGGAYGQYMDRQEAEMRKATQNTGIEVTRSGNDLLLNVPSSVTFATDSSTIQPSARPVLNNVAQVLRNYPNTMVEITGHTDSVGTQDYNLALSKRRANSVKSYLASNGVSQGIMTQGKGESQPIADNDTAAGRAENRRVELKITPVKN